MEKKRYLNIVSGFLGAGKTTFISRLLDGNPYRENIAVCVNEFAENGVDGIIFKNKTRNVKELTSGCICCTLKQTLNASLAHLIFTTRCDRLVIEPSGIAKLSGVIDAVNSPSLKKHVQLGKAITIVDALHFKENVNTYSEIFMDQLRFADTVILSKTAGADTAHLDDISAQIREINAKAHIYRHGWDPAFIDGLFKKELTEGLLSGAPDGGPDRDATDTTQQFQNMAVGVETVPGKRELEQMIRKICRIDGNDLTRIKGILRTEDGSTLRVDYVQGVLSIEETDLPATDSMVIIGRRVNLSGTTRAVNGGWKG